MSKLETKIKGEILRGNCWYCDYLTCYNRKKFSLRNGFHFGKQKICRHARNEIKSSSAKRRLRQELKKDLQNRFSDL